MFDQARARPLRWYLRALGSNPLIRRSDRCEAATLLAVLATAFLAVPVAAQAGTEIYDTGVRTATTQALDRRAVDAVAAEGSSSMPADFDSPAHVRVQWSEGMRMRTELVVTPETVKAGEPLRIWLDGAGRVVAAPLTVEDARLSALGAAGTVSIASVALGVVAAMAFRRRLDRSRDAAWDRELRLLTHNDDGWANRHI